MMPSFYHKHDKTGSYGQFDAKDEKDARRFLRRVLGYTAKQAAETKIWPAKKGE